MKKDSFIAYDEWYENTEDLTDEEFGILMRAVFKYKITGEKPTFSDRGMRLSWKPIMQSLDRTMKAYEAQCERNRENGKKGGRPRKTEETEKPKKANGFFENPPEREPKPKPERDPDPERGRGRGRGREPESSAPAADTTTTTADQEIVRVWNDQTFTRVIRGIDTSDERRERTEMAVAVAGGLDPFLDAIRSINDQSYFQERYRAGMQVNYDWFIRPNIFQKVIEGEYKEPHSKFGDGWEVVEYDKAGG